jgi:outer membrane protein TolC
MLVAPLHGFDPTAAPSFDRNLVRGNLSLRYSLYDGGAREARIRGARAGTEAARAGEASARMEVVMETGEAYLDILSTRELLEAARGQREALEAERSRVLQLLEVGKAARVDLLRVDAALSRSEATEISLEAGLDVARGKLARLTGLSPADVRERSLLPVRLRVTGAPELPVALARAREGSPDLTAARRHRAVAVAAVREARSDWLPTVQLAGVYSNFGALEGGHTQEWQGSLQLSFPLFTGGSREGNLDRAEAEAQEAAEALRLAELRVEDAVEAARAAVVEARARRDALERGVQQAGEVARIEALALEVGSGVQTDFLQAQAELFQARASLAQARHAEMMASVRLARVSGELTLGWFQENMEVMP